MPTGDRHFAADDRAAAGAPDPAHVGTVRIDAARAEELVLIDRHAAEALAFDILERLSKRSDLASAAIAKRVVASARLHSGSIDSAADWIDQSVADATDSGDAVVLGRALMTRMGVYITQGRADDAIADSMRAEPLLPPRDRVRLLIQRATTLGLALGRPAAAIAAFDEAESSAGVLEPIVEAVLCMNRGTQLMAGGDHRRAAEDFERARRRYREIGNAEAETEVLLHAARNAALLGDHPAVFAIHAEAVARKLIEATDLRANVDMCDALLLVGLDDEAASLASAALASATQQSFSVPAAEGLLRAAEIHLALGDQQAAIAAAGRVAELADGRSLTSLSARARLVGVQASIELDPTIRSHLPELRSIAEQLEHDGLTEAALDARILAAAEGLRSDEENAVRAVLDGIPATQGSRFTRLPYRIRAQVRHAHALLHIAQRRPDLARRQLIAALGELDAMRATIGAMDLRVAAGGRSARLAELGLSLAIDANRARPILAWSERLRASAARLATQQRFDSGNEEIVLDALRRSGATPDERRRHESAITSHARQRTAVATRGAAFDLRGLGHALDAWTLIEFVRARNELHAVIVHRGRVSHHRLDGDIAGLDERIRRAAFGLRQMTERSRNVDHVLAMVEAHAAAIDQVLFACLPRTTSRLVIVPTGSLHGIQWGSLPTCVEIPFVVSPSAHLWHLANDTTTGSGPLALIAGPDVPSASIELDEIQRHYARTIRIDGSSAAVARVCDALGTASSAHVCAHGTFRADSPQFSSLSMADGPLTIHDLDTVARLPSLMVLSSCHLGTHETAPGDDLLGFPIALLARRVRTVVASHLPVEDAAARDLMIEFHRGLVQRKDRAAALHRAASSIRAMGPSHYAAAASFRCYGAA